MGSLQSCESCSGCCGGDNKRRQQNTESAKHINPDWANAVSTQNMTGIKILHHTDPDLVNDPVDEKQYSALHYAVRNKNPDLIDYLLTNGANVNIQGGPDGNTALHEATLQGDSQTIKQLFSYGIDDALKNWNNKTAFNLCNRKHKREFTKAKQYREKNLKEIQEKMRQKSRQQKSA
eukprot:157068_1